MLQASCGAPGMAQSAGNPDPSCSVQVWHASFNLSCSVLMLGLAAPPSASCSATRMVQSLAWAGCSRHPVELHCTLSS